MVAPKLPSNPVDRAAGLSLAYNIFFTFAKVVAAVLTGSVALISEAAHSAADIVSSGLAYYGVKAARKPADDRHPYGHGKIESLVAFTESILLVVVAGYVVFEASSKLFRPEPIGNLGFGAALMAINSVTAWLLGAHVFQVGRKFNSLSLVGNGSHLLADSYTSLGVLIALLIAQSTGFVQVDSIIAILLSGYMLHVAFRLGKDAVNELIDQTLPKEEIELIRSILKSEPQLISFHRLRARHSGQMHLVDVHVVVPEEWSNVQAHGVADALEKKISEALSPCEVVIHVDPFDPTKASHRP